jgi:hypothetical protein
MFFSASAIEEYFREINIPYDSEFILVQFIGRNVKISLTEIYHDHPSRNLQRHSLANWSFGGDFIWSPMPLLKRRGDLHSIVLRVGVPEEVSAERFVITISAKYLFVFTFSTKHLNFMFRFILLSALRAETTRHRTKYGIFYKKNLILSKYNYRNRNMI